MSLLGLKRVKGDLSPVLGGDVDADCFHINNLEKHSLLSIYTFNYATIIGQGKPTQALQGVYSGWSLPVYATDNEELFACSCVPSEWDGLTNPIVYIGGWIDTANTGKNFQMQVSWSHTTMDGTMAMDTTTHDVEVSQATGTASQYTGFKLAFTLDFIAQSVVAGDAIGIRVRRIAAASNEITGEFVVEGAMLAVPSTRIGGTW